MEQLVVRASDGVDDLDVADPGRQRIVCLTTPDDAAILSLELRADASDEADVVSPHPIGSGVPLPSYKAEPRKEGQREFTGDDEGAAIHLLWADRYQTPRPRVHSHLHLHLCRGVIVNGGQTERSTP
eukprot:793179-Rhodomonas_salina.2